MGDLGAPDRTQDAPAHQPGNSKVDFWAEMIAPRVDSGPQLRRPGGPKSHFLAKSRHKIEKKSFQEGFQKKHAKIIKK